MHDTEKVRFNFKLESSASFAIGILRPSDVNISREKKVKNHILILSSFILFRTMRTHITLLLLVFALCELTSLATGYCRNYCDNKYSGYGTRPCTKTLTETGYFTRKCGFMWGKRCVTG